MSIVNAASVMDRLGLDRESFRALGLLPLIHIAWADGKLQMGERSSIRNFAKQKGWLTGRVEAVLDNWLTSPPSEEDTIDGIAAFAALAKDRRGLGSAVPPDAVNTIMLSCREVAEASGGLFGLKSAICEEEEVALQKVADALGLARGRAWRQVCDDLEALPYESSAPGSSGHFLLGKAPEMLSDPLSLLLNSWRRFGDLVKIDVGPTFFHLVVHPDDIKHIFIDNVRNYVRDEMIDELIRIFGVALLTSEGEFWRRRRRALQPGFHMQKINGMAAHMADITADFIKSIEPISESGQPIDVAEEFGKLALRVVGRALFHTETESDASAFNWALPFLLQQVAERHRSIIKIPGFFPTPTNLRFQEAVTALDKVIYRTIEERRHMKESPDDLLSLLMGLRDEETGAPLTDAELRNELSLMIIAGHETTATSLSWIFYFLSKHPGAARQVRAEIHRVLDGRVPTPADLAKLEFTTMVIEESMRLRPPAWLLTRKAVAEDRLSDHRIPAGSNVIASPYLTHRHPAFWSNPEGFDPERFSPEKAKDRHPMAYLPFSGGPRKCIGASFAMMEIQIVLAMVMSAYDLQIVPGFEPQISATLTLRPLDGCWMTVHPV